VPKPHTTKACQRGPGNYHFGQDAFISEGGHSFLTMGAYRSKALSVVKPHEELEPVESDHLLRRLMDNPNHFDTAFDLAYELQMFEELCGVAYEWLVPNDYGIPVERWCIPSHWVWPRTGGGRYVAPDHPHADELIQYYEIRPWGGMGSAGMLKFPPTEVIMHRWHGPINKIDGYSKLAAIANWIDEEESISRSRWSQAQNIARPEFWVELSEDFDDPTDDKIARIEAKFAAKIQGELNYGKPVVGPPGAKITPLSFSPTEMAYFQSEEQIRDMILSTFKVPPAAVGIVQEMTYGSILATLAALCTYCLNPRLVKRGQTWSKHLANRWNESGRKIRIWYDDCVPADPTQVNSDLEVDFRACAVSPNEVRAIRGRKPWKFGGDDPMVTGPAGLMPLPLNTRHQLDELADLIAPMSSAAGKQRSTAFEGGVPAERTPEDPTVLPPDEGGVEGAAGEESREARSQQDLQETSDQGAAQEHPNGPPHKGFGPSGGCDEWFHAIGGEALRQWQIAKSRAKDAKQLAMWALIIETNRQKGLYNLSTAPPEEEEERAFRPSGPGGGINPTSPTTHGEKPSIDEPADPEGFLEEPTTPQGPEEEDLPSGRAPAVGDLDELGGAQPRLPLEVLRAADFITLPENVTGTNCGNCMYNKDGICQYNDQVDLRGQPVNERNCCMYWDAPGTLRTWEEGEKTQDHFGIRTAGSPGRPRTHRTPGLPTLAKNLAVRWTALEDRLGRRGALAAAVASFSEVALPTSLGEIVAQAEVLRGLVGYTRKELGGDWVADLPSPPGAVRASPPSLSNRLKSLLKPKENGV